MFKQTFWNNFMSNTTLHVFNDWVKDSEAESKIYLYNYLQTTDYSSIIDMGCGTGTIYLGLQARDMKVDYTGVDSCDFFLNDLSSKGINVLNSDIRKIIQVEDNSYDIAFGRHVLEHQDNFKDLLSEMIRIGKKEALHIFFIKPLNEAEKISYDSHKDLYHNVYSNVDINNFLSSHPKVKSHKWVDINDKECALHICFKQSK